MKTPHIPEHGSLSLLSIGWRGLEAWREARGTDWQEARRAEYAALGATPEPAASSDADPALDVVVVTGLPRSGTSMLMQMLHAGGVAPFTDAVRSADESNPRGYLEHERVKGLPGDTAWVPDADGKAVKVVAPLVTSLPQGPTYRVLLIERDVDEVLDSQSAMLERDAKAPGASGTLREIYTQQLAHTHHWLRKTPAVSGLRIAHADVLADPTAQARRIAGFLDGAAALDGGAFDADAAAAVVDASLHRTRA